LGQNGKATSMWTRAVGRRKQSYEEMRRKTFSNPGKPQLELTMARRHRKYTSFWIYYYYSINGRDLQDNDGSTVAGRGMRQQ
jgi:hypothetical protein